MKSKIKRTPISFAIIALNIIVFIVTKFIFLLQGSDALLKYNLYMHGGSNFSLHTILSIILSGFTHFSLLHIFFNMMFLYYIGTVVEVMIKRVNYALLYFGTLLISGVFVVNFTPQNYITIGASGALYGLLGFLVVYYYLNQQTLKYYLKINSLLYLVIINVIITFLFPTISVLGHLGGLFSGGAMALIINFLEKKI